MTDAGAPHQVTLDDRYLAESGAVLLSGIQALVRVTLDQMRLDQLRGHNTGAFVSGYPGSPLAGVDGEMRRARPHCERAGVVFQPGLNEELAATAVGGTQLLGELSRRRREGVAGFWYGKSPGLDRAADAIRHANLSGTAPLGGAVAWVGDDPASKSSTVPSSCEPMCRSLLLPLLAPASVADVLRLGLHAVALSRYVGVWTAMKIVADTADASATVSLDGMLAEIPALPVRAAHAPPVLLPPSNLDAENDLMTRRLAAAREYARLARLNRIVFDPVRPRFAIVAAGSAYAAVVRALEDAGVDRPAREAIGLRIVKLEMPWPLDAGQARELIGGLERVLVVEDKLPFVESHLKELLYRDRGAPAIVGKEDLDGRPLIPALGTVGADEVTRAFGAVIPAELIPLVIRERLADGDRRLPEDGGALAKRTPYFCSGCPHNISTRASDDQLVGVGIGCHTMVALDQSGGRGRLLGMSQMGGEGAQWLGLKAFTDDEHFIQNLGDGTFHHSGSLAIRAAVAAGATITYKLLYNDAVAMTGGQQPEGKLDVPSLTRWLALEGVRRVIVTTPDPARYRGATLDPIAEVRHRDELQAAQAELSGLAGVTVLLHDDRCATEERRLRKRGKLDAPAQRVFINERVCEGCGDCGRRSSCLSVLPVETVFGRKTRIHQSSCNQDFSCVQGDCPSFVMVTPAKSGRRRPPALPVELVEPQLRYGRSQPLVVRMPGIGGTGVVTISQILQMAAHLDGGHAAGLDQTGLAQKGGPVLADLHFAAEPVEGQLRASAHSVDVLLGFDLLGAAAPQTLAACDPQRTVAILNTTVTPTAAMVTGADPNPPSQRLPLKRIGAVTRSRENIHLDASTLAEALFADHMPANMILVGAAFQHGCLPLSADAIEKAITLNGAAVERNLSAFRWGRAAVIDRAAVDRVLSPEPAAPPAPDGRVAAILEAAGAIGPLGETLAIRVPDLARYQSVGYAREYADAVMEVAAIEAERLGPGSSEIAESYARGLYKLMAYKDEYEVARLHLDTAERARLAREFGDGAKVKVMLHPPILRALGMKRKLQLGAGVLAAFRVLHAMRRLRGTKLDPFGHFHVRRVERRLIGDYRALVDTAVAKLTPGNAERVAEIAALPDLIRGYEQIKLANVEIFEQRARELLDTLDVPLELPMARAGA